MINDKTIKQTIIDVEETESLAGLEQLRLKYLGRKGEITQALRAIGNLPQAARAKTGAQANRARNQIEAAIANQTTKLKQAEVEAVSKQAIDLTAPAGGHHLGHLHPLKELQKQLIQTFWQIGFEVADGPEIETDWYNFEALNIPAGHPARDMFDTFYLENGAIPRTHTSNVQIRYMEIHKPPIRIIATGNVYRNENEDSSHLAVFQQLEGLVVDKGISLADLKGTLLYMFRAILGKQTEIKLLPSYFPFVEPALEVHVTCVVCGGKDPGCRTCKGTGWIEMAGAGMVHPRVLHQVGIDPEVYSGFAFGAGIDRIAAIKHQVPDIRYYWRPDLRFLEQF